MTKLVFLIAVTSLSACGSPQGASLSNLPTIMLSAHLGSPPDGGGARAAEWRAEKTAYDGALAVMSRAWTGQPPASASDLRFTVQQYEGAVRTALNVGGYGNVILAMRLRRMSQFLAARFLILHPPQAQEVKEILEKDRSCSDSVAVADMGAEELGVRRSPTAPKLSEDREELERLFVADRTTFDRASWPFAGIKSARLMTKRDVSGVLVGLVIDELVYRVKLLATIEFLRRGGDIGKPESFDSVMGRDVFQYHFAPLGTKSAALEDVTALIRIDHQFGTPMSFNRWWTSEEIASIHPSI